MDDVGLEEDKVVNIGNDPAGNKDGLPLSLETLKALMTFGLA